MSRLAYKGSKIAIIKDKDVSLNSWLHDYQDIKIKVVCEQNIREAISFPVPFSSNPCYSPHTYNSIY